MSASPRHEQSPNDNVDNEKEEGLEAFPVSVEAESELPNEERSPSLVNANA